jgi:hypothetical protein
MEEQIKKYLNNENIESKFILNRLLRESIYFEQYFVIRGGIHLHSVFNIKAF